MLLTFKSKAASEVLMYQAHAKCILDLLHKNPERGVITAAEAGNAIIALEAEVAERRRHPILEETIRDTYPHQGDLDDEYAHEVTGLVSFATRVYPLLQMLRAAQKDGVDVMWGI